MVNLNAVTIEKLSLQIVNDHHIHADVLRLDRLHEVISGNKWFKLKYYLQEAIDGKFETILTFGGAYSNHIVATACAAKLLGLNSIAIIRGEASVQLSHTLNAVKKYDMRLEFINRDDYRRKNQKEFLQLLKNKFYGCYIIPEGGAGILGVKGSTEILNSIKLTDYSHILCAIGTGTMFAGIVNASLPKQKTIGIAVLKGMKNIKEEISPYIEKEKIDDCEINHDYHFGGYAKKNNSLIEFMNSFYGQTKIPTDFVYTAKLMYGTSDLITKNYFPSASNLLIVHSGGLQGNFSLPKGKLNF